MMKLFIPLFFFFLISGYSQKATIAGRLTSEGKPVTMANIYLQNTAFGTTPDNDGYYTIQKVPPGNYILVASSLGYKTIFREIELSAEQSLSLDLELKPEQDILEEIVIVDEQTGLTRRTPYNISTIDMQGISSTGNPGGIMGILRKVPGVYGAEFGQGIVKPFIRGLGFTRVVTIYQGNKLENHQWGADHGLGINELGVSRVEVIKGPASVLYGSGALGGVLLVRDDDSYLNTTEWTGTAGTTFNSVSNGYRTNASLAKKSKTGFFLATNLAYEDHADYEDGSGRIIGNSRYDISTIRLHAGIDKESFSNKLSLTYNIQNLGIIIDEEMDDSQSLATTRHDRDTQLPFQEVDDLLISYNQTTSHENLETSLHLSHHLNDRKEVESAFDLVDLGLEQHHTFFNGRVSIPGNYLKHSIGIQASHLHNENKDNAIDILIPDAYLYETGIYYLASLDLDSYFLQGAVRYDFRRITADASAQNLVEKGFVLPGDPDDRKLSKDFSGFTGSLGVTRNFATKNTLKLNLSTGFRAPDLAELFSNGNHPGTSRFEKGNVNFGREQSIQADLNYNYRSDRFSANASAFGSIIDNFLFFSATGERVQNEELELWEYQQLDAVFRGFEFDLKHSWLKGNRLETLINGALVRASEKNTGKDLSFIPPDNFNVEAGYYPLPDRSLHMFIRLRLVREQDRTGENEEPTGGYSLVNFGLSKDFSIDSNSLEAGITLFNAFDKDYVDHMSILRAFDISSPGRNLRLNLRFSF